MKLGRDSAEFPAFNSRDEKLARTFAAVERRLQTVQATHLGSAYNLTFTPAVPDRLRDLHFTNPPDGQGEVQPSPEIGPQEREALLWLMRLWGCADPDRFWGAIGASGSESNLWAVYFGREMLPGAMLLNSADAHWSFANAARILAIPRMDVAALPNGEMDMVDLATKLQALAGRPVILALTCGTMMKGAHDGIAAALLALRDAGYDRHSCYVHVDGALNAMVLPFLQDVPDGILPSFEKGIDSLSISGPKMIGTPMPCGVLVARKSHVVRVLQVGGGLRSKRAAAIGSRNGHAVLALWAKLIGQGYGRLAQDAQRCVIRAGQLAADLSALGAKVLYNPFSLTVVFPEPSDAIVRRYQLVCQDELSHAVVMPSVTDALLAQFLADYAAWWTGRGRMT